MLRKQICKKFQYHADCGKKPTRNIRNDQTWKPLRVCITYSCDFIITMTCDDKKETKLTRYLGFTEKLNIQFDDNGQPLYSYGSYIVYVSENRN